MNYEELKKYYLATFPEFKHKIAKWDEVTLGKIAKLTAVKNKKKFNLIC